MTLNITFTHHANGVIVHELVRVLLVIRHLARAQEVCELLAFIKGGSKRVFQFCQYGLDRWRHLKPLVPDLAGGQCEGRV